MGSRSDLHTLLTGLLSSGEEAYFQPPASIKMKYPCFVYTLDSYPTSYADDDNYKVSERYVVKYITRDPDNEMKLTLAKTKGFRFDRYYVADNLHHYVYTYTFY